MKTAALMFGLFWIGFYAIELIAAINKGRAPLLANLTGAAAAVSIGYYFVG